MITQHVPLVHTGCSLLALSAHNGIDCFCSVAPLPALLFSSPGFDHVREWAAAEGSRQTVFFLSGTNFRKGSMIGHPGVDVFGLPQKRKEVETHQQPARWSPVTKLEQIGEACRCRRASGDAGGPGGLTKICACRCYRLPLKLGQIKLRRLDIHWRPFFRQPESDWRPFELVLCERF